MPRLKYRDGAWLEAKRGKLALGDKPSKTVLRRLYLKEERSIREIANLQGCTKDMIGRALKEYKIEVRKNVKRSRLREYTLPELESGVARSGIRGFAREIGVDESTLRHHLKVRKNN